MKLKRSNNLRRMSFFIVAHIYTYIHIYPNLPRNVIVRLSSPRSGDNQGQETFLPPFADKQTRIYIICPTCKQCQKQYTIDTKDDFSNIWDNYKSRTLENLTGKSLAYKNIFIDTLVVQVTRDPLMMYKVH